MRPVRESGGMADTLDLGSSALRREGSSPFSRRTRNSAAGWALCGNSSVVERHLAKVDVAGPTPVSRLNPKKPGTLWVPGFVSGNRSRAGGS